MALGRGSGRGGGREAQGRRSRRAGRSPPGSSGATGPLGPVGARTLAVGRGGDPDQAAGLRRPAARSGGLWRAARANGWWTEGRFMVRTDDAYVQGDITLLAANADRLRRRPSRSSTTRGARRRRDRATRRRRLPSGAGRRRRTGWPPRTARSPGSTARSRRTGRRRRARAALEAAHAESTHANAEFDRQSQLSPDRFHQPVAGWTRPPGIERVPRRRSAAPRPLASRAGERRRAPGGAGRGRAGRGRAAHRRGPGASATSRSPPSARRSTG